MIVERREISKEFGQEEEEEEKIGEEEEGVGQASKIRSLICVRQASYSSYFYNVRYSAWERFCHSYEWLISLLLSYI